MMLAELNIASVDDLETCSLYQLQRAALILASHSGGFRFCEVRGGGRISNVSVFAKQVVIDIATTYSAKKLKKKPKRTTRHVWFNGTTTLLSFDLSTKLFVASDSASCFFLMLLCRKI